MADVSEIKIDIDEVIRDVLDTDGVIRADWSDIQLNGSDIQLNPITVSLSFDAAKFKAAMRAALLARGVELPEGDW